MLFSAGGLPLLCSWGCKGRGVSQTPPITGPAYRDDRVFKPSKKHKPPRLPHRTQTTSSSSQGQVEPWVISKPLTYLKSFSWKSGGDRMDVNRVCTRTRVQRLRADETPPPDLFSSGSVMVAGRRSWSEEGLGCGLKVSLRTQIFAVAQGRTEGAGGVGGGGGGSVSRE